MKTYIHADEFRNPNNEEMNRRGYALYQDFTTSYTDLLNLDNTKYAECITRAHFTANRRGVFSEAERLREYYFGREIHTYGVVYISDACVEACAFCPAGNRNWDRAYTPHTMTVEETVADVLCVMLQGHSKVCILQANWSEAAFMRNLENWLPEVIRVCEPCGLQEIILNVQTLSRRSYRRIVNLRNCVNPNFTIQIRTFQETYLREWYKFLIPQAKGNKHDYQRRLMTQEIAWNAGVDAVGCGVLFGLSQKPLEELAALVEHAQELLAKGINVVRICLPSAHRVPGMTTIIGFHLQVSERPYVELSELIYALARLALPQMNWVMSERDPADLRDSLVRFASETTVGVRPGVGDNLAAYRSEQKDLHFVQTTVYSENPQQYINRMADSGYTVKMNLSEERQTKIRAALRGIGY